MLINVKLQSKRREMKDDLEMHSASESVCGVCARVRLRLRLWCAEMVICTTVSSVALAQLSRFNIIQSLSLPLIHPKLVCISIS